MALVKCSECGKEISDRAGACPGCGAPLASGFTPNTAPSAHAVTKSVRVERAGFKWELVGFILILIATVSAVAGAGSTGFAWIPGIIGLVVFVIGRIID